MGSSPLFPILHYNSASDYVIQHLNFSLARKALFFDIVLTKKTLFITNVLKQLGLILKFHILNLKPKSATLRIFNFFFKLQRLAYTTKTISKPSRQFFISYKGLFLLQQRSLGSVFILSTSRGLLTHQQALRAKIGGLLLFFFSI